MNTIDAILLAVGGYLAVYILMKMMRTKHDRLLDQIRTQLDEERQERGDQDPSAT